MTFLHERDGLVMDWLIVGVQTPRPGRVRVIATKTTRNAEILNVTWGPLAGEWRFSAKSDDVVVCEGSTYAEAMVLLGQRWDADRAGQPVAELEAEQRAIEGPGTIRP